MINKNNQSSQKKVQNLSKDLESLINKVENKIKAEQESVEDLVQEKKDLKEHETLNIGKDKEKKESNIEQKQENKNKEQIEYGSIYTYCEQCQNHLYVFYDKSIVDNATSYPVYIVWVHGKPYHGLLLRIDAHHKSRGEKVVHVEIDPNLVNLYSNDHND